MNNQELIKLAREYTEANYCNGFDSYVECFDDSDWLEFFERNEVSTKKNLISALNDDAECYSDRKAETECFFVCEKCDKENTRDNPKEFCDCNFYPSPDPQELHWQKEERRLNNFQPITVNEAI